MDWPKRSRHGLPKFTLAHDSTPRRQARANRCANLRSLAMNAKNQTRRHFDRPVPQSITRRPVNLRLFWGVLLIAGATLAAYSPALSGKFIWDDGLLITDNQLVRSPSGLYNIWFTRDAIDYWPITNTAFWVEWRLWG